MNIFTVIIICIAQAVAICVPAIASYFRGYFDGMSEPDRKIPLVRNFNIDQKPRSS